MRPSAPLSCLKHTHARAAAVVPAVCPDPPPHAHSHHHTALLQKPCRHPYPQGPLPLLHPTGPSLIESAVQFAVGALARVALLGGEAESGVDGSLLAPLGAAVHAAGGLWVLAKAVSTRWAAERNCLPFEFQATYVVVVVVMFSTAIAVSIVFLLYCTRRCL
jgi:hypothetical protein